MALGRTLLEAKKPLHFGVLRRDQEAEVYGDSTTISRLFVRGRSEIHAEGFGPI